MTRPFTAMQDSAGDRTLRLEAAHKQISNAVAFGLMVYTALQIFLTMRALEELDNTLLPMMALVVLVGRSSRSIAAWKSAGTPLLPFWPTIRRPCRPR
jgi:hypothetical protein